MAWPVPAKPLRIASFHTELHRDGPGQLLQDISKGDPQVSAVIDVIKAADADVLILQSFDIDAERHAQQALQSALMTEGLDYPYIYTPLSNTGVPSNADLDQDGRLGEAEDNIGYGAFLGARAIVVLSKFPVEERGIQRFSEIVHPNSNIPLSSVAHESIPIMVYGKPVILLTHHATPPVFDGPEDRNGIRNALENQLWLDHLNGYLGTPPEQAFVMVAVANIDPNDGEGRHSAIKAFLDDPRLQSPPQHQNRPTAYWPAPGPGPLRVSYILPSADLRLISAGIIDSQTVPHLKKTITSASRHRLIWVDIDFSNE